jgi:hypothetical protein
MMACACCKRPEDDCTAERAYAGTGAPNDGVRRFWTPSGRYVAICAGCVRAAVAAWASASREVLAPAPATSLDVDAGA